MKGGGILKATFPSLFSIPEIKVKNMGSFITKSFVFLLVSAIALSVPPLLNAQQATEELPKALGTYLSAMEGLIKWQDMPLGHAWPPKQYTFYTYGYKKDKIYPTLREWAAPGVKNVSGQDLSMILYFSLGARDPERVKLYRIRTGKDVKPLITPIEEIGLTAVPIITDIPGLAGNMVRLVPDRVLTKGNYLCVEGDIDSKLVLLFSIESKFKLLGTDTRFADCLKILNSFRIMKKDLEKEFENNGFPVSSRADIGVIEKDSKWLIIDKDKLYLVIRKKKRLDVFDVVSEKHCRGFTVDGGDQLWRNPPLWEKCMACLCSNGTESVKYIR